MSGGGGSTFSALGVKKDSRVSASSQAPPPSLQSVQERMHLRGASDTTFCLLG